MAEYQNSGSPHTAEWRPIPEPAVQPSSVHWIIIVLSFKSSQVGASAPFHLRVGTDEVCRILYSLLNMGWWTQSRNPLILIWLSEPCIIDLFCCSVQAQVIPWLLAAHSKPTHYWPRDICVSAPTGSGKTLAFVIPIVQVIAEAVR